MNTITIHKIPALAFVSILSFITGCTTYGGGNYRAAAGTATTTSANMGFTDNLIRNVGPLPGPKSRRLTGSAGQSLRTLEREARRQEREALQKQWIEQREQRLARRAAEREAKKVEEERSKAAMSPAQHQAEIEDRNVRDGEAAKFFLNLIGTIENDRANYSPRQKCRERNWSASEAQKRTLCGI